MQASSLWSCEAETTQAALNIMMIQKRCAGPVVRDRKIRTVEEVLGVQRGTTALFSNYAPVCAYRLCYGT